MNIILLSGGSGKRLWPLSNEVRSKQFLKIFSDGNDGYESMVQRVYHQIMRVDPNATVTIATSKSQVSALYNHLGPDIDICVEPCRRDTFPAIVLASAYLYYVRGIELDETVIVCPVDPYVNDDYFEAIKKLGEQAKKREANLVLMGIEPTCPSEKYGYIIPCSNENTAFVSAFKEKPSRNVAKKYIEQGALWNAGVFAYNLGYVLNKAHELIDFKDYYDLLSKYSTLTKVSFDYAVVEKEDKIQVQRFKGEWKDIGSWNSLSETMEENVVGNVIYDEDCTNLHVINELDIPILCMGLKDIVVSVSSDGILVSNKENADAIKPYVDKIVNPIRYAEKSWGDYKVLDVANNSRTVKISLKAGHKMNYHSHEGRDEIWVVISGNGYAVLDDEKIDMKIGHMITIKAGCRHTIVAETEMYLIEIQMGDDITASDKKVYDICGCI